MHVQTMLLLFALACASTTDAAASDQSSTGRAMDCKSTDCRVPAGEMRPPEGARLSFSQCEDGLEEDFVYVLEQGLWRVVTYSMSKKPACAGPDQT